MSGFPISITWSAGSPPIDVFNQLASAATKLDSALQTSGQKFDQFGSTIEQLEGPLSSVGSSMGELSSNMQGLDSSLSGSGAAMGELADSTGELNDSIGETGGFIQDTAGGMDELSSGASESGSAMEELGTAVGETSTGFEDLGTGLEETSTGFETLGTGVEETNTGFADLVTGVEDTTTGMSDLTVGVEDTATGMEDLSTTTEDTATGFDDVSTAAEDSATSMGDFASGTDDAVVAAGDLQSGIDPLNTGLETMGTGLGTAATEGDTFTGALGGMNDQIPGVTGGLTDANLLTRNLAGGMGDTSSATQGATRSIGLLGAGMGAVIGTGVLMFNAFDRIGDSAVGVELAQGRVITTQSRLEAQMIGLVKKTTELNTKYKDQVTGIGAWNSAMARLDGLLRAGITSGAEWDAALRALKTAQDGMGASTHAGQVFVDQLGAALGRTEAAAIKLTGANLGATNAQEAHNQAIAEMVTTIIPGMLGGFSGVFTALSGWRASTELLKSAWLKLTPSMATILPILASIKGGLVAAGAALGAIAIPAAIAVAAIGAFIAAVTAIRANIKIFDDLGAKVGEVFPEMKGFLEDARQAFINLSDGINSAISFILGGIDSFAGGTTNLKAQWEGFTNTLPKGTGELGMAGRAFRETGILAGQFGETVNIGAGKWKEADGVLMRLNGSVLASANNWAVARDGTAVYLKEAAKVPAITQESTTAMDAFGATAQTAGFIIKEQSANYSELTAAQKFNVRATNEMIEGITKTHEEMGMATAVAVSYLEQIAGVNTELFTSNAIITGVSDALQNQTAEHFEAVRAAASYVVGLKGVNAVAGLTDDQVLALADSLKKEQKEMGKATEETAKHVQELTKLSQAHTDAAAEILFYSDATNMANRLQLEYQAGIDGANLKLIDQKAALANTAGELQRNFELLDEGTLQEIAFAEGVQEAAKMLQDKILALARMEGAYEATNALMKEGTLLAVAFATGIQKTKTAVQENALEVVNLAGELEAYNRGATKAEETNNALMKGFLEQKKALNDLVFEFAEAAGAVEALRMELANSESAALRFNKGLAEGRKSALEFLAGMDEAKGSAIGFRSELLDAAQKIPGAMADMSSKTTEELQQIIEVANGVPGAFQKVVQGIDAMGQEIVDKLSKSGEEGKKEFMKNIDALEKELGVKFSEPLKRELLLQANVQDAQNRIESLLGTLATTLRDKPLEVALETQAAQDAMSLLIAEVDKAAAMSPKFQPLQTALRNLAAWSPGDGLAKLPVLLTQVLQGAQGMEGGMQGAITAFDSMFSSVAQTQGGLEALKTAFQAVGLSFDTTTGKITDNTGKMVADLQVLGEGATTSAATTVTALDTLGPAGTKARTTLAYELVALEFLMNRFAQEVKQSAIEVSTAFSNMGTNVTASLNRLASGIIIVLASFTRIQSDSQRMASTVSGAFSNMSSNTISSMNKMASGIIIIISSFTRISSEAARMNSAVSSAMSSMSSRVASFGSSFQSAMSRVQSSANSARSSVSSLASAINALKSKSITITTTYVYRVVYRYGAAGGAFVASSPQKVGPLRVSEFGQKELVTVTPLEGPGRNKLKGLGEIMAGEREEGAKKGRRALSRESTSGRASGRKEMVMMRETPIIIQVDGREIARVVNKRIFEQGDSLT